MPIVNANDINMYYEIYGQGEPLVYISGFGATTETLSERIAPFSKEYRVLTYDTRGAGRSDVPDIPYTAGMMADDLAGLLDAIGIKAAHICGESFGGYIAQHFVLGYPQKVISLILRCTRCGGPHSPPSDAEYIKVVTNPELPNMSPTERTKLTLPFMFTREYVNKNPGIIEEFLNPKVKTKYPTSPQGMMRLGQVSEIHDTYDRLSEIKVPTLVVHGDADRILNPENARILTAGIPHAELVMFKNAGHLLAEAPEEFNKIALEFLKKHRQNRA